MNVCDKFSFQFFLQLRVRYAATLAAAATATHCRFSCVAFAFACGEFELSHFVFVTWKRNELQHIKWRRDAIRPTLFLRIFSPPYCENFLKKEKKKNRKKVKFSKKLLLIYVVNLKARRQPFCFFQNTAKFLKNLRKKVEIKTKKKINKKVKGSKAN